MSEEQKDASRRCPALNPKSTQSDQCERPNGHDGEHVSVSHSGSLKVYPSKWEDGEVST